jgi:hypothetical protein
MSQLKRALRLRTLLSGALLLGAGAVQAAPLAFEQNLGQTDAQVAYFGRTADGMLFLTPSEIVLRLAEKPAEPKAAEPSLDRAAALPSKPRQHVLRIQPAGALAARLESAQPLESRSSYYRAGAAPIPEVPHFGRVTYRGIYPRTDLVVRGEDGNWAYDFVLAPEAEPRRIALRFVGADALHLEADGSLRLDTPLGPVFQSAPFLYQEVAGRKVQVAGGFDLRADGLVGFSVGAYDRGRELVIDPTVSFKTCVGGITGSTGADGIEVTPNGQAYIVGSTWATDFPHPGGAQDDSYGSDAFVAKLDLAGVLSRATYFHIFGDEFAHSIDLDASNNVVISGSGYGPRTSDAQAWVAKLPPLLGTVTWTTTFGGTQSDSPRDLAVDSNGNVFVGGSTTAADFCTTAPLIGKCTIKSNLGGPEDAFLVKLGPNGGVLWATLAGGGQFDRATAVAVDDSGRPYLGGYTDSGSAPYVISSWVKRFNAAGTGQLYSFPFGTSPSPGFLSTTTGLWDLAVDPTGNAYVTGVTNSTVLEVPGAVQPTLGGSADAFVGMINNSGTGFVYNTYLGGPASEAGKGIRVYNGHAYVAGERDDTDPDGDAFAARYSSGGLGLVFYTAIGGSLTDQVSSLAQDSSRNLYIAGTTVSTDFDPGDASCAKTTSGHSQAYVVKVLP